jgi:hypothetical protein
MRYFWHGVGRGLFSADQRAAVYQLNLGAVEMAQESHRTAWAA